MANQSSSNDGPAVNRLKTKYLDPKSVPEKEWREVLSGDAFYVTRESGTEPAYTGKYDKHFKLGKYTCHCCGADLFVSDSKFNSGCGWPAFSRSVSEDKNIVRLKDSSYGMERVEVRCRQVAYKQLADSYEDLKQALTDEQFNVTRELGTEPKFTGHYNKHFEPGKYVRFCCGAHLFV